MKRKSLLFALLVALFMPWAANAQETLTVCDEGTTTSNSNVPFYGLYADTQGAASECVIPSDMLAAMAGGTISEMKFYITTAASEAWTGTHQVYVGEVDATTLTGITGPSAFTIVKTASFDATGTELTVTFDAPYTYEGGNLLIGTYVSVAGNWKSASFAGISQVDNTGWYRNSASAGGSGVKFLPKTTFTYTAGASDCDMPTAIAVSNVTADGATVTWEGEGDTWNLRYKASTDADFTVVENLTSATYTLSSLQGNTTYSVGVQTVCTGSTSVFKSTSFTTENPCAAPTNFAASNITANSATISWTAGYQETAWTVKYKKSADAWDNATVVTVSGTPTTSLTGLDGLTTYNVRVYNCAGENDPYLTGNFTTGAVFPYSQDFTDSGIPAGWNQYTGLLASVMTGTALTSASYGWSNGTSNGVLDGNHLYANIYSTGCNKWVVAPAIPVESGARLTFDVAYTAFSGTAANPQTTGTDDKFVVLVSTDNMATWTILRQWDNAGSEYVLNELTPAALHQIFDLADYAGQNVNVAFYAESTVSNADNNIHVDNVVFELIPSCEKPTNLSVENNLFDATFTWSSDAASFDVAYSTDITANPDNVVVATVNTTSYEFTNLTLGDHYAWVRTNCSATAQSEWAGPINIHIGYCVPAPTSVDNNGISNVTFGIGDDIVNNNTTMGTNVATYLDYTNLTGALQAGVEGTVAITYKTGYDYGTIIWVDFDNSLSFEESEIVYMGTSAATNPATLNATFVIPATVTPGNYVMRIGGADSNFDGYIAGTSTTAPNPCYTDTWACFQDYTLRVLEAPSCPAPTNFAVASVNAHTARFEWEGTSESYSVSYRTAASLDATFEEHFTGLTSGIPTGWDNSEGTTTTDSYKWSYYNSGHDATPCVRFNSYNNGNGNTNFLKTPSMDFPDFTTMILSFWWKNPTGGDFSVYISTDGGATRALLKEGMTGQSTWKQETITLTDYVGASNVFIYFKGTSNWGNGDAYIYLDDVVIGSEVAAGEWLTVTGIEESTYTIEGLLAETTYEAKIQGNCGDLGLSQETELITFTTGIACYPPLGATYYPEDLKSDQVKLYWNGGDGTYYQLCLNGDESNLIDVEGTVYTWEGLDPETQYTVKVRSNCELSYPGDGVSEWSGTLTFTTLPDCAQPDEITFQAINHYDATLSWMGDSESFTVNYRTTAGIDGIEEEFGTSLPSGWENKSGLLSNVMGGSAFGSSAQWSFGSNNGVFDNHARINIYGSSRYGWLITPEFILASGAVFNFDLALTAYSGTGAASGTCDDDRFVVLVYANEAWTILREWNNSGSADVYNDIPTAGTNVSIDLSAYIGQTVKIAFYGESTESGNGDNNLHIDNVMIGTPFVAGEWQTVTTDQARATIENLTPGTEYEVVIVPSCDENAASDPVNFTTRSANAKIFAVEGDWGNADNWIPAGVPTTEQTVELQANATITGEAFAKSITGTGTGVGQHSLTIEDGGKLKHLEGGTITVTVKKNIRGYNTNYDPETYASGDYYLICNPLSAIFTPDENNGFLVGNYDLYNWQYDASDDLEWRNYRTTSFNLNTGVYGYLYANETGTTLYFTGNMLPYKANEIRSLSAPASPENYDFPGWYLLGNSYMYDAYLTDASENGNGLPYIKMNAAGDGFENIAAGTPIEPMEGFFYQATTTRTVYVSTYEPTVTSNGKLNINLRSANKQLDNAILMFGGNQQMGKMTFRENSSKVYMPVEGKDYAITTVEGQMGEMPVNFKAEKNGSYTLSFTNEDVDFSYLHLIDNLTGEDVDLLAGASTGSAAYTFNASTTDYESRFKLVFATGTSAEGDNFSFVNASGNLCIFGIEGEATVQVIDILGHVISSETFSGSYERKINGAPGVYMVRLINGNDVKVQKVVVR